MLFASIAVHDSGMILGGADLYSHCLQAALEFFVALIAVHDYGVRLGRRICIVGACRYCTDMMSRVSPTRSFVSIYRIPVCSHLNLPSGSCPLYLWLLVATCG